MTTETKHTPVKWRIQKGYEADFIIEPAFGPVVASVWQKDKAPIIAAAPELLEACKAAFKVICSKGIYSDVGFQLAKAIKQAEPPA